MKRTRKKTVPKAIKDHWGRLAKYGCVVTQNPFCTIHHVHGGSIRRVFGKVAMPGTAQKQSHWLTIPLSFQLHTGHQGIDGSMGVDQWEATYGEQIAFLREIRTRVLRDYRYDIYEKAGVSEIV
jgi:hypothetical protein